MKELNLYENIIFFAGGILMAAGVVIYMVPALKFFSPLIYALGAVCYASMQMLMSYEGKSIIIRRLRRQQILSDILLLVTAILLIMNTWRIGPIKGDLWKLTLTVAAIIQLYTAFRIPQELKHDK